MHEQTTFALAVVFTFLSSVAAGCNAQIRGAQSIQSDPFLAYLQTEREKVPPATVALSLSLLPKQSLLPTDAHDLAVAEAKALELDKAETALTGLVAQHPAFAPGYITLARLYVVCHEPERARRYLDLMAREKSISDSALISAGQVLERDGRYVEARFLFEGLLNAERQTPAAATWLGRRSLAEGKNSEALDYFRAAVKTDPSRKDVRFAAAWLHFEAGNFSLASAYLAETTDPEGLELRARALSALGRNAEALGAIGKIPSIGRTAQIIELEGRVRLDEDFSADLSGLIQETRPLDRDQILRAWYGTTDTKLIDRARKELKSHY